MSVLPGLEATPCVIGERMKLTARDGHGTELQEVTWTIEGRIVSGYDPDTGTIAEVESFTDNPIEFHWIESGVFRVKATTGSGDEWVRSHAVSAPTSVTLTAVTGAVGIRSITQFEAELEDETIERVRAPHLAFGDVEGGNAGMVLTARATGTTRAGEIAFVELAMLHRIRTTTTGAIEVFSCHGAWRLSMGEQEEDDPEPKALPVTTAAEMQYDNSPASPLIRTDERRGVSFASTQVADRYRTFLCFTSARLGSIPVALKCLEWSWSGKASYAVQSQQWTLDSSAAAAGAAADAVELPSWTETTATLEWEPATRDATTDRANCYGYALGVNLFITPGTNHGAEVNDIGAWSGGDVEYAQERHAELMAACLADGLALAGPGRRIGLYVHEYEGSIDYHFVRNEDDGSWSHKPGVDPPETGVVDHATIQVHDVTGSHFCGYLFVPPTFIWRMDDDNYAPR